MTLGHLKSKFAEFRTKILVQTVAVFCPLQTDTKLTIPALILFTFENIL